VLKEGIERSAAIGQRMAQAPRVAWLGETYFLAGRLDEAAEVAEQALHLSRENHERGSEAWVLRLLGEIAAAHDPSFDRAEDHYGHALALADQLAMRLLAAHCNLGLGNLHRGAGKREQAREHLAAAATAYREMGMRVGEAEVEAALRTL
jgi:tetratricopeptide (TPR) repeat protein